MRIAAIAALTVCACALATAFAEPQEKSPGTDFEETLRANLHSFLTKRTSKKEERKFAKTVAEQVVSAAHPTHRGVDLTSHQIEPARNNSYLLVLHVTYFGRITSAAYPAVIHIAVESENAGWTVTKLEFQDTS